MPGYVNYFDGWQDRETACDSCEWRGIGSGTAMGELFRDLYERDCPQCGSRLLVVSFPTNEEIRAAAAASNPGRFPCSRTLKSARRVGTDGMQSGSP